MLTIQFKETANTKSLNKELKRQNLKTIVDKKYLNDWVDEYKASHKIDWFMQQTGENDATVEGLKKLFPAFTIENRLQVDFYFNRIDQEEAEKYGNFILKHINEIEYIRDGEEFTNRFELSNSIKEAILSINRTYEEPEKLPIDEQYIPDLQSGVVLMKTMFPDPIWVIYGKVDSPKYLKERIYKYDIYNQIYKDKKGYAYLLVPLAPLDSTFDSFVVEVFENAFNLGIRESLPYFVSMLYNTTYDIDDLVELFEVSLSENEIKEKYNQISNYFSDALLNGTIKWNKEEEKYVYASPNLLNYTIGKLNIFSALEMLVVNNSISLD